MARQQRSKTVPGKKATRNTKQETKPMLLYEKPPREHVLLLSCMDLRLLDNIVVFMNKLNLQNRYDHLTLAGAAMGAMQLPDGPSVPDTLWKHVFFVHLEKAITELKRKIKDIFILEHLDCGAYKKLHPTKASEYTRYADDYDVTGMTGLHHAEARGFVEEIKEYLEDKTAKWKGDEKKKEDNPWKGIRVHPLIMNLLGEVSEL